MMGSFISDKSWHKCHLLGEAILTALSKVVPSTQAVSVFYNLFYFPYNVYYTLQLFIAQFSPLEGQLHKGRKWACVNHSIVPST